MTNIAIENHHVLWENPLYIAISNSYLKLPEGITYSKKRTAPTQLFCEAPKILRVEQKREALEGLEGLIPSCLRLKRASFVSLYWMFAIQISEPFEKSMIHGNTWKFQF